jgi:eukaryotic-like serine/threonine-protein kinase
MERYAPGREIGGFLIGERIHSGGMGHVYLAAPRTAPDPGFPVVMKVPALGSREPAVGLVSFEMELMVHPTLSGAHVPRFVAMGDLTTLPYLVMERIDGESLTAAVRRSPLPAAEVARIGAAIADALHSVHEQHTVHHDLKPENVIMKPDGTAVLVDFGFASNARLPDLLGEEMHFAAGSAPYVSPEQLRDRRGDPRSDVYSLGALLYALAAGEAPFGNPATLAGMRDRLWRTAVPPRARNPDVPPWLQEIILRCLETQAAERYQSAAHVAFDLRNPEGVSLTARAHRTEAPGFFSQMRRWWRTRLDDESMGAPSAARRAPVIMVAVDTMHPDDERQPSIQWTTRQVLTLNAEYRLMCVSIVPAPALRDEQTRADTSSLRHMEHRARLRQWVEPLGLPQQRLSLHVIESPDPAASLLELARQNHVDLIVLGAPGPSQMALAWWRSVASGVTANAHCSVHVVRVPERAQATAPAEAGAARVTDSA